MEAMADVVDSVTPVDTEPEEVRRIQSRLIDRIRRKLLGPRDFADANRQIVVKINEFDFDVLWLDKALTITPETLRLVKKARPSVVIAGYSPDDMAAKHCQSSSFLRGLHLYDIYFTTKSFGISELEQMGCPRAVFVGNAYHPNTHKPIQMSEPQRYRLGGRVGFIGDWERKRELSIDFLARHGVTVRVWGPRWREKAKLVAKNPNIAIEGRPLLSDEYTCGICSFDINLAFLRKINRDLQTTRSVEIPACGAFMLAERTSEHMDMFEEGKEAEYFDNDSELLEKVKYYLAHPEVRKRIAAAGRQRCLTAGYSNQDRMSFMLKVLLDLPKKADQLSPDVVKPLNC
jgi:hypothetical protein